MSEDFLSKIVEHKKSLLEGKKAFYENLRKKIKDTKLNRYQIFKKNISKPGQINLIAEIKKASPSKGLLREDFDALEIARIYAKGGAAAFSVLTEEKFFLGKLSYIRKISEELSHPILMKDFIIDEAQVYEAFALGASAILLILAIVDDDQAKRFMALATRLDMDALVEVHNEVELKRAIEMDAEIIGINNRNLHTFKVDLKVSDDLIPLIPKDRVIVVESGLTSHEEILHFHQLGAQAVLIGETFIKESNIAGKVKEVMYGK